MGVRETYTGLSQSVADNPLRDEFIHEDEDYRYAYAEDFLNTYIATQIKVLRDQREMKQEDLAKAIGTKQSGISRLENVNYSNWKTDTLKKLARAFGVRLCITFETFGSLLDEDATFSRERLMRPKFEDDPAFKETNKETKLQIVPPTATAANNVQGSLPFEVPLATVNIEDTHVRRSAQSRRRRQYGRKRAA